MIKVLLSPTTTYFQDKVLGKGGYGTVYFGRYTLPKTFETIDCAVKFCSSSDRTIREYFRKECETSLKMNHPNIIKFLESGIHKNGQPYLVMEYASNGSLEDHLKKMEGKKMTEVQAKIFVVQILQALEAIHELEIAHRDIKLGNVFLDRCLNIKLGDFGFAKENVVQDAPIHMTRLGTPCYAAPEIAKGERYCSKVDVFSLGIMVNRLLTGEETKSKSGLSVNSNFDVEKIVWPKSFSPLIIDFLKKALHQIPEKRSSISQLLSHEWVSEKKKEQLENPIKFKQESVIMMKEIMRDEYNEKVELFFSKMVGFIDDQVSNQTGHLISKVLDNYNRTETLKRSFTRLESFKGDRRESFDQVWNMYNCLMILMFQRIMRMKKSDKDWSDVEIFTKISSWNKYEGFIDLWNKRTDILKSFKGKSIYQIAYEMDSKLNELIASADDEIKRSVIVLRNQIIAVVDSFFCIKIDLEISPDAPEQIEGLQISNEHWHTLRERVFLEILQYHVFEMKPPQDKSSGNQSYSEDLAKLIVTKVQPLKQSIFSDSQDNSPKFN